MKHVDIVIIGGGIVGLTLACGLHGSGLSILVLDHQLPNETTKDPPYGLRVSTINIASEKLFTHLGIWHELISHKVVYYRSIEVWDKDNFGRIVFSNKNTGYNYLGCVIGNTMLRNILWYKAKSYSDITLIAPVHIKQIHWGQDHITISILQNDDLITASLVVGADGANSLLRNKADIPLVWWNYQHHALVANVSTSKPHSSIARQIFHSDGILAFLPLNDPHQCSIVWSLSPEKAQYMLNIEQKIFNKMLYLASDGSLGLSQLESQRQIFPLTGSYANQLAGHRLVLVGDAAHTMHPLAGQALNFGLMDVAKLIGELRYLYLNGKDIGQYIYLRQYERTRKYDTAIMLTVIQSFYKLFSGTNLAIKFLRNTSLSLVNNLPNIKLQFIHQAMGLYDIPNWLQ